MILPICVKCKKQLVIKKSHFVVKDPPIDKFDSTVWVGVLFECPDCGVEIVSDFGHPLSPEVAEAKIHNALQFER